MPNNISDKAIGVFDSGLGGLTVVKELKRKLPNEKIVYFGDTARVPYGTKSKESIVRFSIENGRVLATEKVKMIVVACNSSSSYAISSLKKKFKMPILGVIKPGVKAAVKSTSSKRIGVIATSATIQSGRYKDSIKKLMPSAKIFSQACPLFVPIVEEDWARSSVAEKVADKYLKPLKAQKIDTLILGCTHYPLLKPTLKKTMGAKVTLIDSAKEMALEVEEVLVKKGLLRKTNQKGSIKFLVSDKPQQFKRIAKSFLGGTLRTVKKV